MDLPESNESVVTLTLRQGVTLLVNKIQSGTKIQYECSLCKELVSSLGYMKVHYSIKHRDPTLKCEFCGLRSFPNEDSFQNHLSTFHYPKNEENDDNPLQCQACGKVSKDKAALSRHIRESHRSDKYPCTICHFEFTRPENLKVHMRTKHPSEAEKKLRPKWECKECGKTFNVKNSMREHVKISHRQNEMLKCDICSDSKEFKGAKVLARHMAYVHEKRNVDKFKCHLCPAKFRNSSHLKRHLNSSVHNNAKPGASKQRLGRGANAAEKYQDKEMQAKETNDEGHEVEGEISGIKRTLGRKCKTVAKEIISKSSQNSDDDDEVAIPSRRVSANRTKPASSTTSKESIEINTETMSEMDGFILNDVIKVEEPFLYVPDPEIETSYNPWDLGTSDSTTTIKTEENIDEKKYFCVYCEKGFSSLDAVQLHEKPCHAFFKSRKSWGCMECDKIFPTRHALTIHMTRHSDEKRYICSLCPSKFKGPSALKAHHSVIHQGKESAWVKWKKTDHSVPCDKCGKVLSSPRNLQRHQREVHPWSELDKKPHKCQLCPNRYRRITTLREHVRLDHEQKAGFECTLCSVWFNRQNKLDAHFKRRRHLNRVKKQKQKKKKQEKRHPGACNILIRNLPETEDSSTIAKKVMEILLPKALSNLRVIVTNVIFGRAGRRILKRIRPLRVILPSAYYKRIALSNVSKLKKEDAFKHLKVTKDFWSKDVGIKGGQLLQVRY